MRKNILTRVEGIDHIIQVTLENVEKNPVFVADIFSAISDAGVNIDMISSVILEDEMRIDFTCDDTDQKKLNVAIENLKYRHPRIVVKSSKNVGKLVVEGASMKEEVGVASEIFNILGNNLIPFSQVTTSEVSISYVIEKNYLELAVQKIKEAIE